MRNQWAIVIYETLTFVFGVGGLIAVMALASVAMGA